ncbi:hypothetical protein ABZ502_17975 [Streptomyces abikoensis]|uniref:hypothetical protein n=1 Tax=Streptomyces abikoensis TaxID=97398 RepID=UPI0033C837C2
MGETGLAVTAVGGYLGHFDYRSGSGRATRRFNSAATIVGGDGHAHRARRLPAG